jgi:hypothetical protein
MERHTNQGNVRRPIILAGAINVDLDGGWEETEKVRRYHERLAM